MSRQVPVEVRVLMAVPVQIWHKQTPPARLPQPPSRLRRGKRGEGMMMTGQ